VKRLARAAVVVLTVTACQPSPDTSPTTTPAPAPQAPAAPLDVYRECRMGGPTFQRTQEWCQNKAWGETFGEEDDRWSCVDMGNRECGPGERKA
jgi:hypothetical protein